MGTVLVPLPACDFDPSEVAVSWRVLRRLGHRVRFATPDAAIATADHLMVTGRGLDPWGAIPGLDRIVLVGRVLRANAVARADYAALRDDPEFTAPSTWAAVDLDTVDGLLLPGGHRARGMRRYLESERLQGVVVDAFRRDLPVAAICHGVLLAARSIDPRTGRSVLYGRRTTALTWSLESRAWRVARVTRFWDRDYYRTYTEAPGEPQGYMGVQQEVTRALRQPSDFVDVDPDGPNAARQSSGRARDTFDDARPAFLVRDGNYLSARWPGDVHTFARAFGAMLAGTPTKRGR
ncbi:type 1 glutamine amidotransferase domain-containing protein [Rhodococcus sp. NPDC127528]|uniref:type 1 glutamine amidotransferase domain-containing protein n=1 Tax=unclassified Rhodococcus (in: high G+C Gram-positive bacteria) TaxID=192944 RepID=UPI0036293915